MQIGMISLGLMGGNMARRLTKGGHQCVVFASTAFDFLSSTATDRSLRSDHTLALVGFVFLHAGDRNRVFYWASIAARTNRGRKRGMVALCGILQGRQFSAARAQARSRFMHCWL
jgi:hypothetical protein